MRRLGISGGSAAVVLLLEVVVFAILLDPPGNQPHPFANAANFALILKYSAIYGIGAIGAALVIATGGIDLSAGAVIAMASVVTGNLFTQQQWPLAPAALAGLASGVAFGAVASLLVVRVALPPFIATLGTMGIARGLAFLITEGRFYDLSAKLPPDTAFVGIPLAATPAAALIVLTTAFEILLTRTALGRHILAVGGNETAAHYAGLATGHIKTFVYTVSGALAALAGVILAVVQGQGKADLATGYELDFIASAVVGGAALTGGRSSVLGAVVGSLIFGVLRNALTQFPGGTFADRLIVGIAVLVIVVADRLASGRASHRT